MPLSRSRRISACQLIRFENDIRLNFKATDFTADEIQFVLSFGEGRAGVPVGKSALATLADEVVNESGLGRLDKEALAQALAGKKTDIHFGVRDDRFTLEGSSTPDEIELMFQLLLAYIVDPAFREDAWQLALNRYQQMYRAHAAIGRWCPESLRVAFSKRK